MTMKKRLSKNPTYRVWVEPPRGDDYAYSVRGRKRAAALALKLKKKGQFNSVYIATGRSLGSERGFTKSEAKKFNESARKLMVRKRKR